MTKDEFRVEFDRLAGSSSSRQLEELLGADHGTIARWRRGEHAPPKMMRELVIEKLRAARIASE